MSVRLTISITAPDAAAANWLAHRIALLAKEAGAHVEAVEHDPPTTEESRR